MPHEIFISHALRCVAKGSIAVDGAVGIPKDALNRATGKHIEALLGVETDQVRLSPDATAAAATDMQFDVGDKIRIAGREILGNLSLIKVTNAATVRFWIFSDPI